MADVGLSATSRRGVISAVSKGASLIVEERERQIGQEGWNANHDDAHGNGELVDAAICYALAYTSRATNRRWRWPWEGRWWKPSDRKRNLVKAGALIAAEIDRLQREEKE
jgi:hypothetical protein